MNETLDGEFQKYSVAGGAYIREHFFGPDPRLRRMVEHLSDDDLAKLRRGGHDYRKVYAAYRGRGRAQGRADGHPRPHGQGLDARSRASRPATSPTRRRSSTRRSSGSSATASSCRSRTPTSRRRPTTTRAPSPRRSSTCSSAAARSAVRSPGGSSGRRRCPRPPRPSMPSSPQAARPPVSTTMVFARLLRNLIRDKELGSRIVPIIPDEARTFGMDPLFKEVGIYAALGQRYEPVDSDLVLSYREATDGQVLEEGITEAGSMASFQAAGTSYATHGLADHPVLHLLLDVRLPADRRPDVGLRRRSRPRLPDGRHRRSDDADREGLQHDDGHTQILASTVPNLRAYDPAFAYELAAVIRDGIERMFGSDQGAEDVFYYVTLYNENYPQAAQARRRGRGPPPGHLSVRRGPRPRSATAMPRGWSAPASILQQVLGRATSWPRSSGWPPRSTAPRRSRCSGATPSRPSAGTGSTPTRRSGGSRTSARCSRTRAARSWPPPTG